MKRPELIQKTYKGAISLLIEECGEVLQAIGKLQRFGERAKDPLTGIEYDNIGDLEEELLDLTKAIDLYYQMALQTPREGRG